LIDEWIASHPQGANLTSGEVSAERREALEQLGY
jgi:hypothetical protein